MDITVPVGRAPRPPCDGARIRGARARPRAAAPRVEAVPRGARSALCAGRPQRPPLPSASPV